MSDHLVSEAIYLTDPDGLGIEVYADRRARQWRYEGRELRNGDDSAGRAGPRRGRRRRARGPACLTGRRWGTCTSTSAISTRRAAFYHEALGFDKVVWGYPGALFLSAGGYHHHLGTNTWAAGAPPAAEDDARLIEWEMVLPDAASVAAAGGEHREAGGKSRALVRRDRSRARSVGDTAVRLVRASTA